MFNQINNLIIETNFESFFRIDGLVLNDFFLESIKPNVKFLFKNIQNLELNFSRSTDMSDVGEIYENLKNEGKIEQVNVTMKSCTFVKEEDLVNFEQENQL